MKKTFIITLLLLTATFVKAQDRPYVENFGSLYFGKCIVFGELREGGLTRTSDFVWDAVKTSFPLGTRGNVRLRIGGRWEYFSLGDKESKMKFHYAGVPVGIFLRKGLFKIGAQCAPEYKIRARLKDSSTGTTTTEHLEGVNPFRLTCEVSASFAFVGLYARYGATPLFKKGYDPGSGAHILTLGLMLDL